MKPLQTLGQVIRQESAKHWLQEKDPLAGLLDAVTRARLYARIVQAVVDGDTSMDTVCLTDLQSQGLLTAPQAAALEAARALPGRPA